MKTIRIMFVEPLGDGGIAHYTYNLMMNLHKQGGKSIGLTLLTSTGYEFDTDSIPFDVHPVMFRGTFALMKKLPWMAKETKLPSLVRRFLKVSEYPFCVLRALWTARQSRVDWVHFQTVNYIEILMILALKMTARRVVFTVHNVNPRHGTLRYWYRVIFRLMYAMCDRIIIHTESGKNEIGELFSVDPGKVSVIPHGDYKFFLPETTLSTSKAKAAIGLSGSVRTVLFFGAIRPNKGLDLAIEALPHAVAACPEAMLVVAGEPCENYERYGDLIERTGMNRHVAEILEYISNEDIHLYFSAADVVILPYREITQSGVLQVAYAFGKPVVATSLDGFVESVDDGLNGYIVPVNDPGRMGTAIGSILTDEDLRESMGRHSRYIADTRYSWEAIADRTIGVYVGEGQVGRGSPAPGARQI